MISKSEDKNNHSLHNTCPYLGLFDDPKTFSAYPSEWNVCHHVTPISTPTFGQQQNFCLSAAYSNCPIFNAPPGQKMLKDIQSPKSGLSIIKKKRLRTLIISAVLLLVILGIVISNLITGDKIGFISQDMNTPNKINTGISQVTSQTSQKTTPQENTIEKFTQTQTEPSPTLTIQLTLTPTYEKPVLALDTPIGDENQFIIHRVAEGESLQIFANLYNTSVEAIRNVNYDLIAPLWIDWLVVIPMNTTDVTGIPTFEPYQVESDQISISELSELLSTSIADIIKYNNLNTEHFLVQGDWLLIPKERSTPKDDR